MLYDFTYQNPTRIHFGKNAITKLANELKAYGENILLIYGKASIKKIGLYDQVINILQAEGTPEEIMQCQDSYTGKALNDLKDSFI